MKRRIASVIIVMVLMAVGCVPCFGTCVDDSNTIDTNNAKVNEGIELDASESNNKQAKNAGAIYYKFSKSSESTDTSSGTWKKVSADIIGTGSFSADFAVTITKKLSISLNSTEESKVTASISGSYGKSLSTSVSHRVNKDRKAKGYLAFKPYYIKVTGTLKTYNSAYQNINGGLVQTRSVTARYPKKLSSGFADGCFKVKYYD